MTEDTEPDIGQQVWEAHLEAFREMTPPLRPHTSEIDHYVRTARELQARKDGVLRIFALGITPEMIDAPWPEPYHLTVADRSEPMIAAFWPGNDQNRTLIEADWFELPDPDPGYDLVLGDGVFAFMRWPEGFDELAGLIGRLLAPTGRAVARVFSQAEPPENPLDVARECQETEEPALYPLLLRLATALQPSAAEGLCVVRSVLDGYLESAGVDVADFYRRANGSDKEDQTAELDLEDYRITYPTTEQFEQGVARHLRIVSKTHGGHELAHRTPMFTLAPVRTG